MDVRDPVEGKPVITMYVRRGDPTDLKTRTVSLHPIPDKVSDDEWYEGG